MQVIILSIISKHYVTLKKENTEIKAEQRWSIKLARKLVKVALKATRLHLKSRLAKILRLSLILLLNRTSKKSQLRRSVQGLTCSDRYSCSSSFSPCLSYYPTLGTLSRSTISIMNKKYRKVTSPIRPTCTFGLLCQAPFSFLPSSMHANF